MADKSTKLIELEVHFMDDKSSRPRTSPIKSGVETGSNKTEFVLGAPETRNALEYAETARINVEEKRTKVPLGPIMLHAGDLRNKEDTEWRRATLLKAVDKTRELREHKRATSTRVCWSRYTCWVGNYEIASHSHPTETLDLNRVKLLAELACDPSSRAAPGIERIMELFNTSIRTARALNFYTPFSQRIQGFFGSGVAGYLSLVNRLLLLSVIMFILMVVLVIRPARDSYNDYTDLLNTSNVTTHQQRQIFLSFAQNQTYGIADAYINQSMYLIDNSLMDFSENDTGDLLTGTGWMQNSWMYLGQYVDRIDVLFRAQYNQFNDQAVNVTSILTEYSHSDGSQYRIPFAFVCTILLCMVISVFMLVFSSGQNLKESLKGRHASAYPFCERVFGNWSHTLKIEIGIDNQKMTQSSQFQILLSTARKQSLNMTNKDETTKLAFVRLGVWTVVALLLGIFAWMLRSAITDWGPNHIPALEARLAEFPSDQFSSWKLMFWTFTPSLIITVFNLLMPIVCATVAPFEKYEALKTQIRVTLLRTVLLRFASIFFLLVSMLGKLQRNPSVMEFSSTEHTSAVFVIRNITATPCFETFVGQQIYKVLMLDMIVNMAMFGFMQIPLKIFYNRYHSNWMRQEFDLTGSILWAIYVISLYWLGILYAPLLAGMAVVHFIVYAALAQLGLLMIYEVPSQAQHEGSDVFFVWVAIFAFFMSLGIAGFGIIKVKPSAVCGPFLFMPEYSTMYDYFVGTAHYYVGKYKWIFRYIASAVILASWTVLFVAFLYYEFCMAVSKANGVQMLKEKIETATGQKKFLEKKIRKKL